MASRREFDNLMDEVMDEDGSLEVSNPSGTCEGNLGSSCIREGIEAVSDFMSDYEGDWVIAGGIGTQLNALAYFASGAESSTDYVEMVAETFEGRSTDDVDVFVDNESQAVELKNKSCYDDSRLPDVDFVTYSLFESAGTFPQGFDEMLSAAYEMDLGNYEGFESGEVYVLPSAEMLFSKTHSMNPEAGDLGLQGGTRGDVEKIAMGNIANPDLGRYEELMDNYTDVSGSRALEALED